MSELSDAINEMRNMRESYDQIAGAAEAYNTGKVQLAENITAKGVQASATETLPELSEKVGAIAQTQTILEGGEVMAAQQFGDGALWNLYQVLADMKTRFMGNGDYAALIVCEYYKGYDSLHLQGADAYYTCDGDLYEYASPNHIWHDSDNGKMNRWVAFLYRNEGARLDITNTAISPRSMYIGGHIGIIEYFVNGRLTELVCGVEETDIVDNLLNKGFSQEWGRNLIIRGIRELTKDGTTNGLVVNSNGLVYIENAYDGANVYCKNVVSCPNADSVILKGEKTRTLYGYSCYILNIGANTKQVKFDGLKEYVTNQTIGSTNLIAGDMSGLHVLDMRDIKVIRALSEGYGGMNIFARNANTANLADIWVGELAQNLRLWGWNPTNVLADPDKKAQLIENIKNHILARVSDATGGTQLVFTVSTNMYNSIANEQIEWQGETMSLADAFLTKNWLLAGA